MPVDATALSHTLGELRRYDGPSTRPIIQVPWQ